MATKLKSKESETSAQILMLGYLCIKGVEGLAEKVSILDRFGLSDSDIAIICNVATQSVRNARQSLKKSPSTK